jgi:cell division protein FtsB
VENSIEEIIKIIERKIKEAEHYTDITGLCLTLDKELCNAFINILSDYKRVSKENEQLRTEVNSLRKENEELKKDYYNVINKIENKIDILDIAISECIYIDDDDKAYKKAVKKDKLCLLNQKRALQELLEEGDLE